MIRIKMENRSKRKRTENWSEDESVLLENLVKERYNIIENKSTDGATNLLKSEAWKQIWERFVSKNRRPRTLQSLREKWKQMKARKQNQKSEFNNDENGTDGESEHHNDQEGEDPLCQETNVSSDIPNRDYKCAQDSYASQNRPKTKKLITQMYQTQRGGIEYKRSLLELNKVVKEQLTNCALEEHSLRMQQLKEEHDLKIKMTTELHNLECENKRLQAQSLRLDIELKKKQLNNFVM